VKQLGAGKLLVAARHLPDPNFAETVVLLTDYSEKGAMGMIVNRRTDVTLARIAPELEPAPGRSPLVFFGGPVAGVLALARAKSAPPDTRRVVPGVYLVDTREVLEKMIAETADPDRLRVYVGYSGWGEGQLEAETARGAWHVVDGDANVVFDPDVESAWERQIQRTEALQASGWRPGHSSAGVNLPQAAAP
jgi:putative transcriptional regulator